MYVLYRTRAPYFNIVTCDIKTHKRTISDQTRFFKNLFATFFRIKMSSYFLSRHITLEKKLKCPDLLITLFLSHFYIVLSIIEKNLSLQKYSLKHRFHTFRVLHKF